MGSISTEFPDVTCVIPTFNDRINLPRAVASALDQGDVEVEVILVDDFSNAQTREFISALSASDPRIRCFFMPANGGQSRARNIGATLARGRFLAFLDQDDAHAAGWYRYAINYLADHTLLGAVSGEAKVAEIPGRFGIDQSDIRIRGLSLVFVTNFLFRKSVFMASGGFPTAPIWRTAVAGEDGVFRTGIARNWHARQIPHPALTHRAKERGATVFFLDRTEVKDGRVVMTRLEPIEMNGELDAAQNEFWDNARRSADEVAVAVLRTVEGRNVTALPQPSGPDITCVIPCFNDRVNLPRAVRSALDQAGVDVEVILVDDCSDEETRAFIKGLAETDPRISCFMLPFNGGQGQARNIGATLARTRHIAFLDQDDEHAPGWYRHAIDQLNQNPQLGALSGHAKVTGIPQRFGIDESELRIQGLSLVFIANMVFRRSVFLASCGYPTLPLWRTRVAGEDSAYREAFSRNWRGRQVEHPALIHRAKEGGATVFFLDRTQIQEGRVVMTRLEAIELSGELSAATAAFRNAAAQGASEIAECLKPI
jgi:glycosyltransferase involved in cell wall biosynthesis